MEGDVAEHALFNCPSWTNERLILENYVGEIPTTNTVEVVVSKEEYWKKFYKFCQKIMKAR
jgi:hypothetical protein